MNAISLDVLAFGLSFAAFSSLAFSMERHAKQVWGSVPALPQRRLLAALGWVLLVLALWPAVRSYGPSIGTVAWIGYIGFAAFFIGVLLCYRPRPLRYLAPAAAGVGIAVWLLA